MGSKDPPKRQIFRLQSIRSFVGQETADGKFDFLILRCQSAIVVDEIGQMAIVGSILRDALLPAVDQHVKMQLGMQVRREHAAVRTYGAHLVTSLHQLAQLHIDSVQMAVQRLTAEHFLCLGFAESMAYNDHLSPSSASIGSIGHQSVSHSIYRVAQIGVAAADTVPVLAQMTGVASRKPRDL